MGFDLRRWAHVSMMDRRLDFIFAPFISRAAVDTYRILIISAQPSTTQPYLDPPPPGYQPRGSSRMRVTPALEKFRAF